MAAVEFVIRAGREPGRVLGVDEGETLVLGRLPSSGLVVDDELASRRHCTIAVRDGEATVSDLESANGTFVNGLRVTSATLAAGDQLRVGNTVLERLAPRPSSEGPPPDALASQLRTAVRRSIDPARPESLSTSFSSAAGTAAHRYLRTMHQVSARLAVAVGTEALSAAVLEAVLEATRGERAAILLRGEGPTPTLEPLAVRQRDGRAAGDTPPVSLTVVQDVLDLGVSVFSPDALADVRYEAGASVVLQQIRAVMCAPLRTTDAILGVIYVDSHVAGAFDDVALELLAAIGNQAGLALHRARLLTDLDRLFLDVTRAIAATIDAKDGYTHRHSERVSAYAGRLARQLGLDAHACRSVELAALLHDLGKIGVPDAILNKAGELTPEEYHAVRQHPVHGARILGHIQGAPVAGLLPGIRHHHERWDGSGYPDGLSAEAIPLAGRIIAVADFLDALSSVRTYQTALPMHEVVRQAVARAGTWFDPQVVAAAATLHGRGELG
jgi:HD-GYP domain-containing protein (c-di-GMP phosphodiesterase class II)